MAKGQFEKGHKGGPGRPKGARNKLSEDFLSDMYKAWAEHGPDSIEKLIAEDNTQFVKIVASILPKDYNVKVDAMADATDDDVLRELINIRSTLAGIGVIAGVDETSNPQQTH